MQYKVKGYYVDDKVSVVQGIIGKDGYLSNSIPNFTDYSSSRSDDGYTEQEASSFLNEAINHSLELSQWINTAKHKLEPSDLKSDGWDIHII